VFGRGRVALSVVLNCFMNTLFRNPVCFGLYKIQHASMYKKKKKKKKKCALQTRMWHINQSIKHSNK